MNTQKPVSKDIIEKIRRLKREGKTYREIKAEVGYSHETCRRYSKDIEGQRLNLTRLEIYRIQELRKSGHSLREIARKTGHSFQTCKKYAGHIKIFDVTSEKKRIAIKLANEGWNRKQIGEVLGVKDSAINTYLKIK